MHVFDAYGNVVPSEPSEDVPASVAHPELITREPLSCEVLPSSTLRDQTRGVIVQHGMKYIPIFCANCGKSGGYVPEPSKDFAFYLCDSPCGEMWSDIVGYMVIPQEKFWETARQEQLERYGREMTPVEMAEARRDPNHWIHKLIAAEQDFIKDR